MGQMREGARHEASKRKLGKARKQGENGFSRELTGAAGFLAVLAVLWFAGAAWLDELAGLATEAFSGQAEGLSTRCLELAFRVMGSLGGAAALVTFVVGLAQVGPRFKLRLQFERLDPIKGLGRVFSRERLTDLLWMMIRLAVLGVVAFVVLRILPFGSLWPAADSLAPWVLGLGRAMKEPVACLCLTVIVLALADQRLQRRRFLRKQRMTDDERKREHKEQEGDPALGAERKRRHKEILQGGLGDLRRASVLVVNPTHVAAALSYRPEEDPAPVLLLSGSGALAQRMRLEASRLGLPLIEHVPLARALLRCQAGECIPENLYQAAAEVLKALEPGVSEIRTSVRNVRSGSRIQE